MDIGALAADLWKGKGKGKNFSKSSGKGNQHWNFMKGKGKGKDKESQLLALLRFAGRVVRQDTLQATARATVFQLLKEKNFTLRMMQESGLTLMRTTGPIGPNGRSTR